MNRSRESGRPAKPGPSRLAAEWLRVVAELQRREPPRAGRDGVQGVLEPDANLGHAAAHREAQLARDLTDPRWMTGAPATVPPTHVGSPSARAALRCCDTSATWVGARRTMPQRNRVDPYGTLLAVPDRGGLMGNRGKALDLPGGRTSRGTKHWIYCSLDYAGASRANSGTATYTKLFFLDEATALTAGHRPCWRCLRQRADAFLQAVRKGRHDIDGSGPLDDLLHADRGRHDVRLGSGRTAFRAAVDRLPDGGMVEVEGRPWLKLRHALHRWTPSGYDGELGVSGDEAWVLTPATTLRAYRAGFQPTAHASAGRASGGAG